MESRTSEGVSSGALGLFAALSLAACSADNFGVSGDGDGDEVDIPTGGTVSEGSGGSHEDDDASEGGGGQATGGGSTSQGTHRGPALSDIDTTQGGMNGDLATPTACPEFPVAICVEITGLFKGSQAISASCDPAPFENDSANVSCQGEGMRFALNLKMFSGAPPSSYNFTADPEQYPLLFEWSEGGFATHQGDAYALAATHEFAFRTTGVVYEEEFTDSSRRPYVAGTFAATWTKRPTCPACADLRLRGTFSVFTGL